MYEQLKIGSLAKKREILVRFAIKNRRALQRICCGKGCRRPVESPTLEVRLAEPEMNQGILNASWRTQGRLKGVKCLGVTFGAEECFAKCGECRKRSLVILFRLGD